MVFDRHSKSQYAYSVGVSEFQNYFPIDFHVQVGHLFIHFGLYQFHFYNGVMRRISTTNFLTTVQIH